MYREILTEVATNNDVTFVITDGETVLGPDGEPALVVERHTYGAPADGRITAKTWQANARKEEQLLIDAFNGKAAAESNAEAAVATAAAEHPAVLAEKQRIADKAAEPAVV